MFNIVVIEGRLTADAELKTTPNGISVTSFTIANDIGYGDNKKTAFINVVAWRKTAEFITKNFTKGSLIGIEGSIQTRNYEDKDGNKRTAFEVVCDNAHFVGSRKETEDPLKSFSNTLDSVKEEFSEIDGDDDLPFN